MEERDKQTKEIKRISDVTYKSGFSVDVHNLLDEPKTLQFPGYEVLVLDKLAQKDGTTNLHSENMFKPDKVTNKTEILVILTYFEYVCIARVSFSYLMEILKSGLDLIRAFDMIKHHLRIILNREVNGIENIVEMHVEYMGRVKY